MPCHTSKQARRSHDVQLQQSLYQLYTPQRFPAVAVVPVVLLNGPARHQHASDSTQDML